MVVLHDRSGTRTTEASLAVLRDLERRLKEKAAYIRGVLLAANEEDRLAEIRSRRERAIAKLQRTVDGR